MLGNVPDVELFFSMSTTTITRRHSLRIPAQPPPTPIPPSLRESPYLNATLFNHDLSLPRLPSDEDERWLQDTVPLTQGGTTNAKGSGVDRKGSIVRRSWPVDPRSRDTTPSPTTDGSDRAVIPPPPLSPPIVHWRAFPTTRPDHLKQTRSESNITSVNTRNETSTR
jgi:hypothetical protein